MGASNPQDLGNGGEIDGNLSITGDLTVSGGIGLTLSEVIQGTSTIDVTNTEALLVRKDSDGGDVFIVDTTNSRVGIGGSPSAVLHLFRNSTDTNLLIECTHASSSASIDLRSAADRDSQIMFREGSTLKAQVFNDASADSLVLTDGANSNTVFIKSNSVGIGTSSPAETLDVTGTAKISGNVAIGASVGSYKLEVSGGDVGLFKSVSSGSGINNILTLGATDGGVNMSGGEGAGILFKIPDDETNPSIGAQIGAIKENGDDSVSSTALVFSTSQNDETLDEAMRIDSSGNVGIGMTPTEFVDIEKSDNTHRALQFTNTQNGTGASGGFKATSNAGTLFMRAISSGFSTSGRNIASTSQLLSTSTGGLVIASSHATADMSFWTNNTQRVTIDGATGSVGIGNVSPDTLMHIHKATAGTVDSNANAQLTIENSSHAGIQFLSPNDANNIIYFGDVDDNDISYIGYLHSTNDLQFFVNGGVRLQLNANSRISLGNNDSSGNIYNTIFGHLAGNSVASGATSNTLIGYASGDAITTGSQNTAVGESALSATDDGASNVAIGNSAMGVGNAGTANTAVGSQSMIDVTGNYNTAVGMQSLFDITSGASNIGIGALALKFANAGESNNIAVGVEAMRDVKENGNTADSNIALGSLAMMGGTLGGDFIGNIAIGDRAMDATDTNAHTGTIAIGHHALTALVSGSGNTAVGYTSGADVNTGANNTFVGYEAGNTGSGDVTDGQANTIIGSGATANASGAINRTAIGRTATAVADNSVTLGNASVTAVYMAQDSGARVYCARIDAIADLAGDWAVKIHNDGNNINRFGLELLCGADDASGTNYAVGIKDGDGSEQGYITFSGGTVTYGAFTANHDVELPTNDKDNGYPYGTLVEHTEVFYKQKNGSDTERGILYKAQKSSSAYAKNVLGAYAGKYPDKDNLHQVYILGDGHILCNGEKGNIAIGDGICTSSTSGQGMKADKMAMCIGIAQEDVTFDGNESKLVAVQYALQQFTPWN